MDSIKIQKKETSEWTSFDFVRFFSERYQTRYSKPYETLVVKDCITMKRIISIFRKFDRPKTSVIKFIDWVFEEYSKDKKFTTPLTIGFLPYWIDQFLQVKTGVKKKQTIQVELSEDTKKWLEEQKALYKDESAK